MIQFNLLPDVKQEYLKARRTRQLVVAIALISSGISVAIMVLLLVTVNVVQKARLSSANDKIVQYSKELKSIEDLDKILTVQNQLKTLTGLHDQKPVVSRLFTYISQLTPSTVTISSLNTDHTANTMTITGEAPSLDTVNVYTDTLKETTYKLKDSEEEAPAFSDVVLSSFGRDSKGATYTITATFKPDIFVSSSDVTLTVPNKVTGAQQQLFQKKAEN